MESPREQRLEDAAPDRLIDVQAKHCRSPTTTQQQELQWATNALEWTALSGYLDRCRRQTRGHWLSLLEIEVDGIGCTACC